MIVLDSSALLAVLQREAGSDVVRDWLPTSVMSVANLAEVLGKGVDRGLELAPQRQLVESLGVHFEAVTTADAVSSAAIRASTARALVLSLGDRLCLALALRRKLPVLTADRIWADIDHGVDVQLLR